MENFEKWLWRLAILWVLFGVGLVIVLLLILAKVVYLI